MSEFNRYRCAVCTHIYDEAKGDPGSGIEPGTRWEDIPEDWVCPECGATKKAFKLMKEDSSGSDVNYERN